MKRIHLALVVVIVGLLVVTAGFIPLTKTVVVTEQKTKEVIIYREETKTKVEMYTEEQVIGTESKQEVLLKESIPVVRGSTSGKTFSLTAGDIIIFKAHSTDTMMISFTGQGEIYMSIEMGTDIEKEFTIKKDGEHTMLYSPASVTTDIVIDFDIIRIYEAPITEEVEKTREVEYTERVPYTEEVPYTEKTAKEEKYTLDLLKYLGAGIAIVGLVLYIWGKRSKKT